MHFDLICIQPSLNQPVTLLYWGRKMLSVCRRQYKAFVSVPGCLVIQNQRPHQGESISKLQLLSFRKDFWRWQQRYVNWQRISNSEAKAEEKEGFGEESGSEVTARTPKLFEELMWYLELVAQMKGQLWSDRCPKSPWKSVCLLESKKRWPKLWWTKLELEWSH